jgi:hypothetical protein
MLNRSADGSEITCAEAMRMLAMAVKAARLGRRPIRAISQGHTTAISHGNPAHAVRPILNLLMLGKDRFHRSGLTANQNDDLEQGSR